MNSSLKKLKERKASQSSARDSKVAGKNLNGKGIETLTLGSSRTQVLG